MLKIIKICLLIVSLPAMLLGTNNLTTGDLIITLKNHENWPPRYLVRPELTHVFDTENFRIHFDTEGENAVYHPDEDIDPTDGIPDYINRMAEYLEWSHYTYIMELGYDRTPPDTGLGGNDNYDIYVTDIVGLTVPEFRSDYYPNREAYVCYSYIGKDLRNEHHPDNPYPFLMATCSHEYFHATQMAYRGYTSDETPWWYELTATWAEERVFDELNEVYYYIEDYYDKIDKSIYLTGGSHMYGAWLFAEYLSQQYGVDIIKSIFNKLISFDYSLDAIVTALFEEGITLDEAFSTFTGWNYFTSYNFQPGFFEEGMDFPVTVPLAKNHTCYPTGWIDTPKAIENLGIAYIYFDNPGISKGDLVIMFESSCGHPEGLSLAALYPNEPVDYSIYIVEPFQNITLRVNDFSRCDGAVLSINWLYQGYPIFDSTGYLYRAYLDTSSVGINYSDSHLPDDFYLLGNYPNPFNVSCDIIFNWNLQPVDYTIAIYDINGRCVDRLLGTAQIGSNIATWTPVDDIAGGVYFYRLQIGYNEVKKKMLLLK